MLTSEQDDLARLYEKFKGVERESRTKAVFPEDCLFGIRLDGFKQSKNYLKDVLINRQYNNWVRGGIVSTYKSFKKYMNLEYENSFLCVCSFSDEVTFILLGGESRYDRRTMKYCTLFSGVMSAAMTRQQCADKTASRCSICAFDSRPLILANEHEAAEYIISRYLVAKRQAYWKVLRLRGYPGCNEDSIKGNLVESKRLVIDNGWEEDYLKIHNQFRLYTPTTDEQGGLSGQLFSNALTQIDSLEEMLTAQLGLVSRTRQEAGCV